jgi:hypothetical protein
VLYCFFVIGHDRRKILRCNETRNPHALWIVQQMREAWPYAPAHRFLLFDHDSKFGNDVVSSAKDMGGQPVRTAFRSPWRTVLRSVGLGSCRRDLLDHVIVLNERHLKRLTAEYVHYYHEDRTHLGLGKDTPAGRPIAARSSLRSKIPSRDSVDCTIVTRSRRNSDNSARPDQLLLYAQSETTDDAFFPGRDLQLGSTVGARKREIRQTCHQGGSP